MVLLRFEEKTFEDTVLLGIKKHRKVIEKIVRLCRGDEGLTESRTFFSLFMDRDNAYHITSTKEVARYLQEAWWIEEEDMRQIALWKYIYLKLYREGISDMAVLILLSRKMRDYLVDVEKIFRVRGSFFEDISQYDFEDPSSLSFFRKEDDLASFLNLYQNRLTYYQKYVLYLTMKHEMTQDMVETLICLNPRMHDRDCAYLKKLIGDHYGTS